jgi:hypothetical protein
MRTRGLRLHGVEQRALDLAARHVRGVRDAARAVAPLEVQVEVGVPVAWPSSACRSGRRCSRSIATRAGPSFTQISTRARGRGRRRRRACRDVRLERVARAEDGGDAALRVLACSTRRAPLRDDDDVAVGRRLERERQPGDAAADDEVVVVMGMTGTLASAYSPG